MCPACIANAAQLIVTGAVSAGVAGAAGGWTAFALRKPGARSGAKAGAGQPPSKPAADGG